MEVNVLLVLQLYWWGRRGLRAIVGEEEMEMYAENDRCKNSRWDGKGEVTTRGARGGEVEKKDTEMSGKT